MKQIEHYHSGGRGGYLQLAKAMSEAIGEQVYVENNALLFPPSFLTGRVSFYEISEELSISIIDCVFHEKAIFNHHVVAGSDNYEVMFNVGDQPIQVINEKGEKILLGDTFAESVFFSSYANKAAFTIEDDQPVKAILVHVHRNWIVRYLSHYAIQMQTSRLMKFINYEPLQLVAGLDLKSSELITDILMAKGSTDILPRLLEGLIYQLMSMFCNNLVTEEVSEKQIVSEDVTRVLELKKQLEQNLGEPLIPLEKAAELCLMSRTKFIQVFRSLFDKNYSNFFLELRMEKSKELLTQGLTVVDVSFKIGYGDVSPFIKAFKLYYGVTPRTYQISLKRKRTG